MNNSSGAVRGKHPYCLPIFWIDNLEYFCKTYPTQKERYIRLAQEAEKEILHLNKFDLINHSIK